MPILDDVKFLKIMVLTSGPVPAEQNARYILNMFATKARAAKAILLLIFLIRFLKNLKCPFG
jgi:hypothetical protein